MSPANTLGPQLRILRNQLGISQAELAKRLEVSLLTVNRWESGKSEPQRLQQEKIDALLAGSPPAGLAEAAVDYQAAPETPRRRGMARSKVLGNRSMEQMLWDAACSIRGEKDAPKFKNYILPLLFIKRLSDVFDDEIARLSETYGDDKTALKVLEADHSLVRFYLPPEARWPVVSGRVPYSGAKQKAPATLGEQLTLTFRAIARQNATLQGVIDAVDFNAQTHGEREISDAALKGVIETISDPRYRLGLKDVEPDFLGRCYEYLLRKFAEGSGQSAGEFFTPTEVGFLMAEILRPRPGEECYDYACGSLGLLIKLQLVCKRHDPLSKIPLRLHGQELQGDSFAIARMNAIIHDMSADIVRGDTLINPKFRGADGKLKTFDLVVANPMWNQPIDPALFENDPFERFIPNGGQSAGKGDWGWLQHSLASLKEGGRAAVVLDTGAVSRGSGSKNEDKERAIRKWFVEKDFIDGVILLPDNLFYNTTAAGVIVFLRKGKPKNRRGKIVLINASGEFKKGAPKNHLTDEGIKKIATAYLAGEDVAGFVKVITTKEAAAKDYNLMPAAFVRNEADNSYRPIAEIVNDLKILDEQSKSLGTELMKLVESL